MKTFKTSGQLRYISGFKYQATENWWIELDLKGYQANYKNLIVLEPDGKLSINEFFGCDGPSGPTVDTDSAIRAAFTHDALYKLLREGLIDDCSKYADEVLRDLGIFDGMWKWRAWSWYWGVRKFAFGSRRRQERKERLAP